MTALRFIANRLTWIAVLAWLMPSFIVTAQTEQGATQPIRLGSYSIAIVELRKPIMRWDMERKKQRYEKAYLVTLKGDFPLDRAPAMELFIGDYRVPEYGGTEEGLYFKIYDPRLIQQLEGAEFRYSFQSDEIKSFDIQFSLKQFQPLKTIKEK